MKLQFLLLLSIFCFSKINYSQDNTSSIKHVEDFTLNKFNPSEDNFLLYRSQNMFQIKEIFEEKINQYEKLDVIYYRNNNNEEEYLEMGIQEFVLAFNNNEINPLLINVKRSKESEKWYRLGNTNYVLIGFPEDRIVKDYNQTTK